MLIMFIFKQMENDSKADPTDSDDGDRDPNVSSGYLPDDFS